MRLVRHLSDLPYERLANGSVVTIGAFDGIHLGHRQLLRRVVDVAMQTNRPAVAMSFEPTPKEFFGGDRPPARLMRFREKLDALAERKIDVFFCPRFNEAMRGISADAFIRRVLVHGLNARHIVVGDDFQFARRREGSVDDLLRVALEPLHKEPVVGAQGRCQLWSLAAKMHDQASLDAGRSQNRRAECRHAFSFCLR